MNLIVVVNNLAPYHVPRLRILQDKGFTVTCVQIYQAVSIRDWILPADHGINLISLGFKNDRRVPGALLAVKMVEVLKTQNFQAICVTGYSSLPLVSSIVVGRFKKAKVIIFSETQRHEKTRKFMTEFVKRCLLRFVDSAFVSSSKAADYFVELGFDANRISVGYSAVDNSHFSRTPLSKDRDFSLGFLFVGRLSPEKNIDLLLKSYEGYVQKVENPLPLTFVGSGPLQDNVLDAAHRSRGAIMLKGFVQQNDLPAIYHSSYCLILPSSYEPWGLVANEAQAAALPVIITHECGAANELVIDNISGLVVAQDKEEIIQAMVTLHCNADLRSRMADNAVTSSNNFSITNWGEKLEKLIHAR